jgi:hypothetical protein
MGSIKTLKIIKRVALEACRRPYGLPEDTFQPQPAPEVLSEKATEATLKARAMGLSYYGFDRWGKDGFATYMQNRERTDLIPLKRKAPVILSDPELRARNVHYMKNRGETHVPYSEDEGPSDDYNYHINIKDAMHRFISPSYGLNDKVIDKSKYSPLNKYDIQKLIEDSQAQYKKLTREEKEAVKEYTGSSYVDINKMLRTMADINSGKIIPDYYVHLEKHTVKAIVNMTSAFKHFKLGQEVITYRGVSKSETEGLEVGDTFDVQQYISTSINADRGIGYGADAFVIRVPKGTHGIFVAGFSQFASENELLLDRGLQLKVLRKTKRVMNGRKFHYYRDAVEEIRHERKNPEYTPKYSEVVSWLDKHNPNGIRHVFVLEVAGRKKLVSMNDLKDTQAFIARFRLKKEPDWEDENSIISMSGGQKSVAKPTVLKLSGNAKDIPIAPKVELKHKNLFQ